MPKIKVELEVPDYCKDCGFFDDECKWCKFFDTAVFYNKNKNLYERCEQCKQAEVEE